MRRYPNTTRKVVQEVSLQCALNSRVAIVGANGAGKSTIVKMLTGEMLPTEGTVWKHPNMRVAYVAQHAFHHLEKVRVHAGSCCCCMKVCLQLLLLMLVCIAGVSV